LNLPLGLVYTGDMPFAARLPEHADAAVTPSRRTLHSELLRLCARIGYSPPLLS